MNAPTELLADPDTNSTNRRRGLIIVAIVVIIGLLGFLVHWMLAPPSESTDDAYVSGNVVTVTARDAGTVSAIHADNTQSVAAGSPLVDLDAAAVDVQTAAAEAGLASAVRAVRGADSRVSSASAAIRAAQDSVASARGDLARRRMAAGAGAVSGEEVAHASDTLSHAEAELALARAQASEARASVSGTSAGTNPQVLAAEADVRRAAIAKGHLHITAPIAGVIAQRNVQLGQQVAPGAALMSLVSLADVWIDANFRETQLARLRIGQPATITSDAYGSGVEFHGRVIGIGAGSGSAFALLPAQNASGNWIKIVQRLPVRIAVDPADLRQHPLRIGLSVIVTVDTSGNATGIASQHSLATARPVTSMIAADTANSAAIDARIHQIIAANQGR